MTSRLPKELLDELREAAGSAGRVRRSEDEAHAEVRVSDADGIARVMRISGRERIPVFTRLYPFGGVERAQAGIRSILLDVTAHSGIVRYSVSDRVLTARAGTPLADIAAAAAEHRQRLPVDPPAPRAMTIGEAVAKNEWGPLRTGWGTLRNHVIGCQVILPNGIAWTSGGPSVKSATGYDLHRLQVGALESLAVGSEYTVRLTTAPAIRVGVVSRGSSLRTTLGRAFRVRELPDPPAALFVLDGAAQGPRLCTLYEGVPAAVDRAALRLQDLFGGERVMGSALDALLDEAREAPLEPGFRTLGIPGLTLRLTCRPSRLLDAVEAAQRVLEDVESPVSLCAHPDVAAADLFIANRVGADPAGVLEEAKASVAAAGGGAVRLRRPYETHGGERAGVPTSSLRLLERVKHHFDPANLLNPGVLPYPAPPAAAAARAQAKST